ncbi:hypothetical protein Cni_G26129 [Canna indica]|uniref:GRF-type domain-containing protein n=1 Tax=Canna indica TaxID=4628 RepID=A0AAQ3QPZ6_9LILI|nr:hypothetical protein Cni_G26129 [Canna indica]
MPSARHALNNQPSLLVSGIQCPCGGGSCIVLATQSGKNMGRQYYRCPLVELMDQ